VRRDRLAAGPGIVLVTALLAVLTMAPTVGDVGGCGREASRLDEGVFARARKLEDCERCRECGIETARCKRACDARQPFEVDLPVTCQPLYHDGEVCLRALHAASCDKYATYVDDAPATPSECDFCKVPPAPPIVGFGDASPVDGGAP